MEAKLMCCGSLETTNKPFLKKFKRNSWRWIKYCWDFVYTLHWGSIDPHFQLKFETFLIYTKYRGHFIRMKDPARSCKLSARVLHCHKGTPTKRQVSKRQVSKRPVSKRLKRRVYKTSGLQNVRFTKCQVYKTSGLQNVWLKKKHPYIFRTCGWWKSAGSVAAMFAGKVMAVFYSLF